MTVLYRYRVTHLLANLGWVDFHLGCPAAQPVLPISYQPRQNQAEGGTAKIKANPTQVRQEMCYPVCIYDRTVLPEGLADLGVSEYVVRRGRLLYPREVESGQLLHPLDRLIDAPLLVRVHHHHPVGTHGFSDYLAFQS